MLPRTPSSRSASTLHMLLLALLWTAALSLLSVACASPLANSADSSDNNNNNNISDDVSANGAGVTVHGGKVLPRFFRGAFGACLLPACLPAALCTARQHRRPRLRLRRLRPLPAMAVAVVRLSPRHLGCVCNACVASLLTRPGVTNRHSL
ncbi:hypothetical protein BC831DRAFT_451998 [Entophlyctis helioformis]|nr:hypothetical protein BC831DRAFT_451998 [Entophlyctis helioformis]